MPQKNVANLPMHMQRDACEAGLSALVGGPEYLCRNLDHMRSTLVGSRPNSSTDLGVFYNWLQASRDDPAVQQVVDCVRDYVIQSYPITHERDILGKPSGRFPTFRSMKREKERGWVSVS